MVRRTNARGTGNATLRNTATPEGSHVRPRKSGFIYAGFNRGFIGLRARVLSRFGNVQTDKVHREIAARLASDRRFRWCFSWCCNGQRARNLRLGPARSRLGHPSKSALVDEI
jgi:hypothetical protein